MRSETPKAPGSARRVPRDERRTSIPRSEAPASARGSVGAEVRLLNLLVLLQALGVVRKRDRPRLQNVAAARDVERHQGVLLDEEDRRPLRVDLADDLE